MKQKKNALQNFLDFVSLLSECRSYLLPSGPYTEPDQPNRHFLAKFL
jgi:hypothetical protein